MKEDTTAALERQDRVLMLQARQRVPQKHQTPRRISTMQREKTLEIRKSFLKLKRVFQFNPGWRSCNLEFAVENNSPISTAVPNVVHVLLRKHCGMRRYNIDQRSRGHHFRSPTGLPTQQLEDTTPIFTGNLLQTFGDVPHSLFKGLQDILVPFRSTWPGLIARWREMQKRIPQSSAEHPIWPHFHPTWVCQRNLKIENLGSQWSSFRLAEIFWVHMATSWGGASKSTVLLRGQKMLGDVLFGGFPNLASPVKPLNHGKPPDPKWPPDLGSMEKIPPVRSKKITIISTATINSKLRNLGDRGAGKWLRRKHWSWWNPRKKPKILVLVLCFNVFIYKAPQSPKVSKSDPRFLFTATKLDVPNSWTPQAAAPASAEWAWSDLQSLQETRSSHAQQEAEAA